MVKLSLCKPCFNPKLAKVGLKEKGLCCEHDLVLALSEAGWVLWKTTARLGKGKKINLSSESPVFLGKKEKVAGPELSPAQRFPVSRCLFSAALDWGHILWPG